MSSWKHTGIMYKIKMTKTVPLMIILLLSACQSNTQAEQKDLVKYFEEKNKSLVYETEVIDGLTIPAWLKGRWQNIAESNTNNIVTYLFRDHKLTIRQGLRFQGTEKLIESYKDFKVSESSTDSTYAIQLTKNKQSLEYEFKLRIFEWSGEKVLTYSIVENGELKRDHLESIQLVLYKI